MKNLEFKIYEENDQNKDFYAEMGEFFANRSYAKEFGGWQFYNEPNSVWFISYISDQIVGFCAVFNRKTHIFWDNFYILKDYRGLGISTLMIKKRFLYCQKFKKEIRSITDNPIQMKNYKKIGMVEYGKRGRYTKYRNKVASSN